MYQYHRPPPSFRGILSGMLARLTPVVKWLIGITLAMFLVQIVVDASADRSAGPTVFERLLELRPQLALGRLCIWQFVSYLFLHDVRSVFHIFFNLFVLFMFGPPVELVTGGRRFLALYLVCGIGAGLAHSIIALLAGDSTPVVGASGAILGVMAAFAFYYPNQIIYLFMVIPIRAKHFVLLVAGLDLWMTFSGASQASGIASIAHLGGLATGWVFVRYQTAWERKLLWWKARIRGRRIRDDRATPRRVDELLAKVHDKGMGSLSFRERRFLKRASKRFKDHQ